MNVGDSRPQRLTLVLEFGWLESLKDQNASAGEILNPIVNAHNITSKDDAELLIESFLNISENVIDTEALSVETYAWNSFVACDFFIVSESCIDDESDMSCITLLDVSSRESSADVAVLKEDEDG